MPAASPGLPAASLAFPAVSPAFPAASLACGMLLLERPTMVLRAQTAVARVLAVSLALPVVVVALRAAGDDGREAVRLEVNASPGCPGRAAFEARVLARTTRALLLETGDGARTFAVSLDARPRPHGRLTVLRGGAVEGTREVHADTCADVADALALVAALAIDPALPTVAAPAPSVGPASPPGSAAPSASAAPPAASASASAPVPAPAPASASAPAPATAHLPAPAPTPPPVPSARDAVDDRPPRLPHTLSLGADLDVATGVSPQALSGVSPRLGWRSSRGGFLSPSVTASFLRAASGTLAVSGGAASFTWTVGRLDGCFLSWPPGTLRLLGCVRAEAGLLEASGTEVPSPQSASRAWAAVGPLLRGEWELLAPLYLSVEGAAMARITADRFFFRPNDTTVYPVPLLGLEGSGGLGVHFL